MRYPRYPGHGEYRPIPAFPPKRPVPQASPLPASPSRPRYHARAGSGSPPRRRSALTGNPPTSRAGTSERDGPQQQEATPTSHFEQIPYWGPHGAASGSKPPQSGEIPQCGTIDFDRRPIRLPSDIDSPANDPRPHGHHISVDHPTRDSRAPVADLPTRPARRTPKPDVYRGTQVPSESNVTPDIRSTHMRLVPSGATYPGTVARELPAPTRPAPAQAEATGPVANPDGGSAQQAPPHLQTDGPTQSPPSTALNRSPDTDRPSMRPAR